MDTTAVVAVGASAGGLRTLTRLVAAFPEDLAAAVLVTVHVGERPSNLPAVLSRAGPLPAAHARDGEPVRAGRIYVAPPGRHLFVTNGIVRLRAGPRLNGHRPSVDAMFTTAANWADSRTVAIVLSGALDDGAVGAAMVSLAGGRVLVEDPTQAQFPGMPRAALSAVPDATIVSGDQLGVHVTDMLTRLLHDAHRSAREEAPRTTMQDSHDPAFLAPDETHLTRMVCPDCNGSLAEIQLPHLTYYRCHVGHHFAPQSLTAAQEQATEARLWTAVAALEEAAAFTGHLADRCANDDDPGNAREHRCSAERATRLARHVRAELDPPPTRHAPKGLPEGPDRGNLTEQSRRPPTGRTAGRGGGSRGTSSRCNGGSKDCLGVTGHGGRQRLAYAPVALPSGDRRSHGPGLRRGLDRPPPLRSCGAVGRGDPGLAS